MQKRGSYDDHGRGFINRYSLLGEVSNFSQSSMSTLVNEGFVCKLASRRRMWPGARKSWKMLFVGSLCRPGQLPTAHKNTFCR